MVRDYRFVQEHTLLLAFIASAIAGLAAALLLPG
jgi:hypothetical protein